MTDFSKFTKEINSTLYERAKSPLYSSFAISWVVTNWKLIYVTLFLDRVDLYGLNKLDYITRVLYGCLPCAFFKLLLIPAAATALFIWVLPYLEFLAFKAVQKARAERNSERLIIQGEATMSGKHFIQLKKDLNETVKGYSDVMNEKENIEKDRNEVSGENVKLKSEVERIKSNIQELEVQNKNLEFETIVS
jgi:hypothetical protein